MEKRFLMKLLLLLSSVLVITGCATTSVDPMYPNGPSSPWVKAGSPEVASLEATGDLWMRIRGGFAMPDLEHDLVRTRSSGTRPDYIQRMTERSSKYLFHIVEELERRGMPTELALLPFIESAFNPQAVSSAAGMWQFMPATGTYFDLKQNVFRDDRRDVLASTRAALDYLQKLYGMFGDWHLALAAYNWGEGSVGRAIKRNEKLGQPPATSTCRCRPKPATTCPSCRPSRTSWPTRAFNTELPIIENHPISRPWICRTTSTWSWWPSWPMSASRTSRHSTPAFTSR
jgi:membrane-bound lytic murein transglycosylase D